MELDDLIVAFLKTKGYGGKCTIAYSSAMACADEDGDGAQVGISRFVFDGSSDKEEEISDAPMQATLRANIRGIVQVAMRMSPLATLDEINRVMGGKSDTE